MSTLLAATLQLPSARTGKSHDACLLIEYRSRCSGTPRPRLPTHGTVPPRAVGTDADRDLPWQRGIFREQVPTGWVAEGSCRRHTWGRRGGNRPSFDVGRQVRPFDDQLHSITSRAWGPGPGIPSYIPQGAYFGPCLPGSHVVPKPGVTGPGRRLQLFLKFSLCLVPAHISPRHPREFVPFCCWGWQGTALSGGRKQLLTLCVVSWVTGTFRGRQEGDRRDAS